MADIRLDASIEGTLGSRLKLLLTSIVSTEDPVLYGPDGQPVSKNSDLWSRGHKEWQRIAVEVFEDFISQLPQNVTPEEFVSYLETYGKSAAKFEFDVVDGKLTLPVHLTVGNTKLKSHIPIYRILIAAATLVWLLHPRTQTSGGAFDPRLYELDAVSMNGSLRDGAVLFRLTSPLDEGPEAVLSGREIAESREQGLFNYSDQLTTYCYDNALACIAEKLASMYCGLLRSLVEQNDDGRIRSLLIESLCLVVFRVHTVAGLVFLDSIEASRTYGPSLRAALQNPTVSGGDRLRKLSSKLRHEDTRGVVYSPPSHSRGHCFAFFGDATAAVQRDFYLRFPISLQLIREGQDLVTIPSLYDPYEERTNAMTGYYRFANQAVFADAQRVGIVNPVALPNHGYVEFVRKDFAQYLRDAVVVPDLPL